MLSANLYFLTAQHLQSCEGEVYLNNIQLLYPWDHFRFKVRSIDLGDVYSDNQIKQLYFVGRRANIFPKQIKNYFRVD
jgi:hypothetical protein